jgi:hypothetical protein
VSRKRNTNSSIISMSERAYILIVVVTRSTDHTR